MNPPGDDHDLRSDSGDDGDHELSGFGLPVPGGLIPEELYSFYEGRPFKSCTRCGEGLADFVEGYRVSKVIRAGEVIFEYALCVPCLRNLLEEASEESKRRLMEFQISRFRGVSGLDDCALCDHHRETMAVREYGLVGICVGEGLADSNLICGDCMEAMSACLSEQTRRSWDRFVEENFPGVPADFEPVPSIGPVPVF